MRFIQESKNNC